MSDSLRLHHSLIKAPPVSLSGLFNWHHRRWSIHHVSGRPTSFNPVVLRRLQEGQTAFICYFLPLLSEIICRLLCGYSLASSFLCVWSTSHKMAISNVVVLRTLNKQTTWAIISVIVIVPENKRVIGCKAVTGILYIQKCFVAQELVLCWRAQAFRTPFVSHSSLASRPTFSAFDWSVVARACKCWLAHSHSKLLSC